MFTPAPMSTAIRVILGDRNRRLLRNLPSRHQRDEVSDGSQDQSVLKGFPGIAMRPIAGHPLLELQADGMN